MQKVYARYKKVVRREVKKSRFNEICNPGTLNNDVQKKNKNYMYIMPGKSIKRKRQQHIKQKFQM